MEEISRLEKDWKRREKGAEETAEKHLRQLFLRLICKNTRGAWQLLQALRVFFVLRIGGAGGAVPADAPKSVSALSVPVHFARPLILLSLVGISRCFIQFLCLTVVCF